MTRSCGTNDVADGCTTTLGIETCYCSGDLCTNSGAVETTTNAAGVIAGSTLFTLMALIVTKFL